MADNPFYRFFRRHDVPMAWQTWTRLPRFPYYKNEYWDGEAHYSARIETVDMYLDLARWKPPAYPPDEPPLVSRERVAVRPLREHVWMQHLGIGSALLGKVVHALRERGFRWLCSTCLTGNSTALLWHWRNGFTLGAGWFRRMAKIEPDELPGD